MTASPVRARNPQNIILAFVVGDPARDEEPVGQPVEVFHPLRVDRRRPCPVPRSFRSARRATVRQTCRCADSADPPGRMKLRNGSSRAFIASISASRPRPCSGMMRSAGYSRSPVLLHVRSAQVRAQVEQVVLDRLQLLGHLPPRHAAAPRQAPRSARPPCHRPRPRAECLATRAAIAQRGLARVTRARVDLVQNHHVSPSRLVADENEQHDQHHRHEFGRSGASA